MPITFGTCTCSGGGLEQVALEQDVGADDQREDEQPEQDQHAGARTAAAVVVVVARQSRSGTGGRIEVLVSEVGGSGGLGGGGVGTGACTGRPAR